MHTEIFMTDIVSGHAAIDRYLADGYEQVQGMSSRFAAAICGHIIRRQSGLGISGHMVEIGPFEGRFFIAMALGLAPGEIALGIDLFDWPDAGVRERFLRNCRTCGVGAEQVSVWQADSAAVAADALRARLNGAARFFHIDATHDCESLAHDLALAHAVLHPAGIIAVDDMLHPGYPTLVTAVLDFLSRRPEMRVLCIIDREDVVAAAKFLLCRADAVALYERDLMETFAPYHFVLGADMISHLALVLTPQPRLADVRTSAEAQRT
jgi:hypothetical protein